MRRSFPALRFAKFQRNSRKISVSAPSLSGEVAGAKGPHRRGKVPQKAAVGAFTLTCARPQVRAEQVQSTSPVSRLLRSNGALAHSRLDEDEPRRRSRRCSGDRRHRREIQPDLVRTNRQTQSDSRERVSREATWSAPSKRRCLDRLPCNERGALHSSPRARALFVSP